MSIEEVLASCVILQFALLLILFGWKRGVEHRLDIMYSFMRESDKQMECLLAFRQSLLRILNK